MYDYVYIYMYICMTHSPLLCVTVGRSVLQCVAAKSSDAPLAQLPSPVMCCSALQCVAVCCNALQHITLGCSVLQRVTLHSSHIM